MSERKIDLIKLGYTVLDKDNRIVTHISKFTDQISLYMVYYLDSSYSPKSTSRYLEFLNCCKVYRVYQQEPVSIESFDHVLRVKFSD